MNGTLTKSGIFLLPLVFLMIVSGAANSVQAGVENWYWYYWRHGHWGSGYNPWYYQGGQNGYQQGYSDGSNNYQYGCSGHTLVYCASYGHGYADGQVQYNQDQNNQQLAQNQASSSSSYSQSNSNVKVIINNVIPSSNKTTARPAQNSGTGENN